MRRASPVWINVATAILSVLVQFALLAYHYGRVTATKESIDKRLTRIERVLDERNAQAVLK